MKISFSPIGIIYSPFQSIEEMPIQPTSDHSAAGTIQIAPEYVAGLRDLAGFSHIYLLYHFHEVRAARLTVTPFLDQSPRGIFATRAPTRPNPIGLSLVELVGIEDDTLSINNLDVLNETPLLDIKPYIPAFEQVQNVRVGWLTQTMSKVRQRKADSRFK